MIQRRHVRWAVGRAPLWALLVFGMSGALHLLIGIVADFPMLDEVGHGDSYILHDVVHFRRTGIIHRDPNLPPYPPAQYSPLLYIVLALPDRIVETANPFLGPRAVILLAFGACVAITGSITGALIPVRRAPAWAMLLASSIETMQGWALQLRADFLGAAFGLLSVRLLLGSGRWTALLAGAAAGMSFQSKITFVAALVAGGLWLLASRRWRDFGYFAAAGTIVALGPYAYFQLREPQTFARMLISDSIVRDVGGLVRMAWRSAWQPVCLLAMAALPLVLRRGQSRWWLVLLFATTSFAVALTTGVHAGANRNYFFEGLFAITPMAVLLSLRLPLHRGTTGVLAGGLLMTGTLVWFAEPNITAVHRLMTSTRVRATRVAQQRAIEMLQRALPGHRVLSTVPRIALLTDAPVLTEPYFMAYRQKAGISETEHLLALIRMQDFEVAVTPRKVRSYRGIPMVPPDVASAIAEAYEPFCAASEELLISTPRRAGRSAAAEALRASGCAPDGGVEFHSLSSSVPVTSGR